MASNAKMFPFDDVIMVVILHILNGLYNTIYVTCVTVSSTSFVDNDQGPGTASIWQTLFYLAGSRWREIGDYTVFPIHSEIWQASRQHYRESVTSRDVTIRCRYRKRPQLVWCAQWYAPQITKFMGPTSGPPGSCRPQMGPMLAPWTLLSGTYVSNVFAIVLQC